MALPTQTTLLSAVNACLRVLNEAQVSSLDAPFTDDVARALDTINDIQVEVLGRAYTFNSDYCVELVLDSDGKYAIPPNVLRITLDYQWRRWCNDLVPRDDAGTLRLYNRRTKSFVLPSGLKATLVYTVDFEDMPEPFRNYIKIRAAHTLRSNQTGTPLTNEQQIAELRATKAMKDYEVAVHPRSQFQNWSVFRVIDRGYPDTYGHGGGTRGRWWRGL